MLGNGRVTRRHFRLLRVLFSSACSARPSGRPSCIVGHSPRTFVCLSSTNFNARDTCQAFSWWYTRAVAVAMYIKVCLFDPVRHTTQSAHEIFPTPTANTDDHHLRLQKLQGSSGSRSFQVSQSFPVYLHYKCCETHSPILPQSHQPRSQCHRRPKRFRQVQLLFRHPIRSLR